MQAYATVQIDGVARPGRRPRRATIAGVQVSGRAARVYGALTGLATNNQTNASSPHIGERVNAGRFLVCAALRELEEAKLIRREYPGAGRRIIHII